MIAIPPVSIRLQNSQHMVDYRQQKVRLTCDFVFGHLI